MFRPSDHGNIMRMIRTYVKIYFRTNHGKGASMAGLSSGLISPPSASPNTYSKRSSQDLKDLE